MLAGIRPCFDVVVPAVEEIAWSGEAPASFALRMAHEKAMAVAGFHSFPGPTIIIAADTIVVLGRRILGKPRDADDARQMLRDLSGREHVVITGVCVMRVDGDRQVFQGEAVRTTVQFRDVGENEISTYVDSGEPMDKAGAYAIQGGAAAMIDHIEGSYTNVIGLPLEALERLLGENT